MATMETSLEPHPRRTAMDWQKAKPLLVPFGLVILAYLPLLILQTRSLWDSPHYGAFPVALAASLVLAWISTRTLGPLEPGSRLAVLPAVGFCGILLTVAGLAAWPWLGALAAMLTVLTVFYGLGGLRLVFAGFSAWVFAALALLPPTGGDVWLVGRLQSLITRWSSSVLDLMGILHVTEGNVVKIVGHPLLIEEACSGIRSLMVVLGSVLFFARWTRRGMIRSTVLLLAAARWGLLGNAARVVCVVWMQARAGIDLSRGTRHELLGLLILVGVLVLTVSTDQLLRFFSALWAAHWRDSWDIEEGLDPMNAPVAPAMPPAPAVAGATEPTVMPDLGRSWLVSRRIAAVFGILALAQWAWLWPLLRDALPGNSVISGLQTFGENDLEPRFLGRAVSAPGLRDRGPRIEQLVRRVFAHLAVPERAVLGADFDRLPVPRLARADKLLSRDWLEVGKARCPSRRQVERH